MKRCPDCQNPVEDDAIFCDRCGYRLSSPGGSSVKRPYQPSPYEPPLEQPGLPSGFASPSQVKTSCPSCGYLNTPGEKYCVNCGSQLAFAPPAPIPPARQPAPVPVNIASIKPEAKFCPTCGFINPVGETYCENCGFWLVGQYSVAVAVNSPAAVVVDEVEQFQTQQPSFETSVGIKAIGRFLSRATNTFIPLLPKGEILMGRRDPERKVFPDIDLSGQGSGSNSVSRHHARLLVQGVLVYVEDLNSTNGTYLNKQRLQPGQRHLLKNGDELRLGGLILIYQSD